MNSSTSKSSSFIVINYLLLLGIGLIWGSQYFLNKIALESFSNWIITAARVTIGSIVLTLLLTAKFEKSPYSVSQGSSWWCLPDFILIGFFEATLPCLLIAWAQKQVPSSITAILIGTVPLFATVLEALFIKTHPFSGKKAFAILLGFLGVIALVGPGLLQTSSTLIQSLTLSLPLLPVAALLFSALSFAISVSLIKARLSHKLPPLHAARGILVGATITAVPLLLLLAKPWRMTSFSFSPAALWALILLGIFGGGIVYTFYVKLINRAGPSFASTANYLALPIGAFIGIAFAQEPLTLNVIASSLLILIALWLSSGKKK
ncbi:MAG: DMT family transporter [Chthoniobacterales bacterium]|nr:DMT family transporter [Chthoniobacterales bacterium]